MCEYFLYVKSQDGSTNKPIYPTYNIIIQYITRVVKKNILKLAHERAPPRASDSYAGLDVRPKPRPNQE